MGNTDGSGPTANQSEIATVGKDLFGWNHLRAGQADAISGILAARDTLAVMPTGHGKSAIYQIAGSILPGPTIVVSPLIALQVDQIKGLAEHPAASQGVAVNSTQGRHANEAAWTSIENGIARFLFLSPEQLANSAVLDRLKPLGVTLFVVDEAHSISAWGHDFRPDYLKLGDAIDSLGHPAVLALTATGSPPVRDEIVALLRMRNPRILSSGFNRPNLRLEVVHHEDDKQKRAAVIAQTRSAPKPGLVYVATRRDTDLYADELRGLGTTAVAYNGGLGVRLREQAYEDFHNDLTDVVVATSAFGMGIDKPDVRFVIHAAITESLESYYQEIGRAGRDGTPARVTLHYRAEDLALRNYFASHTDPQQTRIDLSRLAMMRSYAETSRCRRQFLLGYFGEDLPEPCGNCDTCSSGSAYKADDRDEVGDPFQPATAVIHDLWGAGVVMSSQKDRITVFFTSQGYKTLSREAVSGGMLRLFKSPV